MIINISEILSQDLKFRQQAKRLKDCIDKYQDEEISLDFKETNFASRAFIDEFYNLFLKESPNIKIINVPEDLAKIIETISNNKPPIINIITSNTEELYFDNVEDFIDYIDRIMTPEQEELLCKELCARLPYGLKCQIRYTFCNETTNGEDVEAINDDTLIDVLYRYKIFITDYYGEQLDIEHIKPYLRPLSSMTRAEEEDLRRKTGAKLYSYNLFGETSCKIAFPSMDEWGHDESSDETDWVKVFDWLNQHHFDYNKLIDQGLALEAPKDMY